MRIVPDRLKKVASAILLSLGASSEEADLIAESLVKAEMRGIPTHGVNFLPMLAERIGQGLVTVPTPLQTINDEDAVAHIDGGNGLGQVAADFAMAKAIEKASRFGIGAALVRNTNHIGLLAFYTMKAAANGMVGFCMSNSAPSIAPWGGREAFFGTNPFSVAAPCGDGQPVVLDMSTSVVARGKIRRAIRLKEDIPPGWALDGAGAPTTDPEEAMNGTLLPIGGPKGYGMAFFIDLISGLLSGSKFSRDVSTFHKPIRPTGVGVTTVAIDIRRFMPIEVFAELVRDHVAAIRDSEKVDDAGRIYLPGQIEAEREALASVDGIELDLPVQAALEKLIESKGLDVRLNSDEVSQAHSKE
ncbi:MAG: Ldh family oxidoreductase [Spirochaetales bacterium]|nr:Ldh family oxidoreductase [Spirochaetales bacterium]